MTRRPLLYYRGFGENRIAIYTPEECLEYERKHPSIFIGFTPNSIDIFIHNAWLDIQAKNKKKKLANT